MQRLRTNKLLVLDWLTGGTQRQSEAEYGFKELRNKKGKLGGVVMVQVELCVNLKCVVRRVRFESFP
jgi:hypothetical protein